MNNKFISNPFLKVPLQDQIMFAKHLAIMSKAGMSLINALEMIKKQAKSKLLSKILNQIVVDISNGQFLSASLEQYRNIFGDLFVNIIRTGEASGTLSENLNYLAEELKKKRELRQKIQGALLYPFIILIATIGIVGVLIFGIFPKILPVFKSLNLELPLATKILIMVTELVLNKWAYAVLILIGISFVFWLLLRSAKIKFYYHKILLITPYVGSVIKNINLANLARTLSILLKSDVKIVESLSITANTMSNLIYKKELLMASEEIKKGEQISNYLFKKQHIFPLMFSQMIEVGENTGNLSETLLYLSDFYESEVEETMKNLSGILEPLLLVVMGISVGFVAIAIITPIYKVTQTLGR